MKKLFLFIVSFSGFVQVQSQLHNNGGTITVATGAQLVCNGDIRISTGNLVNNGTVKLRGNLSNQSGLISAQGSTIEFFGNMLQQVSGIPINAGNVIINNSKGIYLGTDLSVTGSLDLIKGLITSDNAMFVFENGSVIGTTPSDQSHVNAKVKFKGVGSFIYPVGNSLKYQPVKVNLTTNNAGLIAEYFANNSGAAPFSTTGTENTPLLSYNYKEYWTLNPPNAATAEGNVTISWDGYNDAFSTATVNRRVAHKLYSHWLNEGANTVSGNITAGNLTSNNITTWGSYTLGSVNDVLPISWLAFYGLLNGFQQPEFTWKVSESNVLMYALQKSSNARDFFDITLVKSKSNGINTYHSKENLSLNQPAFYRIKQTYSNGAISYSGIIKLEPHIQKTFTTAVIPSLTNGTTQLRIETANNVHVSYSIIAISGQVIIIKELQLNRGTNLVDLPVIDLPNGKYIVTVKDTDGNYSTTSFVKY